MLLTTGASEASAGSAWGWGPTRFRGGGAPRNKPSNADPRPVAIPRPAHPRTRDPATPRPREPATLIHVPPMDFRLSDEQQLLRRQRARVRGSRDPAARHGVGRGPAVPHGPAAEAGRPRADGHPVRRGVRRRGHVGGRLLHLHRGAGARVPGDRVVGRGAQRAVLGAHRHVRQRGAEADLPAAADSRRGARRVGADRGGRRQRCRRDADDGDPARRRAGC